MDENRIAGTARNVAGKAQEGLGRVVGDMTKLTELQTRSKALHGSVWTSAGRRFSGSPDRHRGRRPKNRFVV
jgi:uncharacterized protein YjbJ (UPF0337 family)